MPKPALRQVRDLSSPWHNFAFIAIKFLHVVQNATCITHKKNPIEIQCHAETCPSAA